MEPPGLIVIIPFFSIQNRWAQMTVSLGKSQRKSPLGKQPLLLDAIPPDSRPGPDRLGIFHFFVVKSPMLSESFHKSSFLMEKHVNKSPCSVVKPTFFDVEMPQARRSADAAALRSPTRTQAAGHVGRRALPGRWPGASELRALG